MSEIFDAARAGSTMRGPLLERCHRARSNDRREDEPLDRVSEAIFPVAARHDIHPPHLRAGIAHGNAKTTPLEHCDIIVTAVDDRGTAKSFATSGNATLLAASLSTPARDIV